MASLPWAWWLLLNHLFHASFVVMAQVFKNVSRATTSGVVGTWWFEPAHAGHFCSTAVTGSFIRSITYSLGSICFGSLIVAILQMLRDTLRRAQNDRNGGGILSCIAVCILAYIERYVALSVLVIFLLLHNLYYLMPCTNLPPIPPSNI